MLSIGLKQSVVKQPLKSTGGENEQEGPFPLPCPTHTVAEAMAHLTGHLQTNGEGIIGGWLSNPSEINFKALDHAKGYIPRGEKAEIEECVMKLVRLCGKQ